MPDPLPTDPVLPPSLTAEEIQAMIDASIAAFAASQEFVAATETACTTPVTGVFSNMFDGFLNNFSSKTANANNRFTSDIVAILGEINTELQTIHADIDALKVRGDNEELGIVRRRTIRLSTCTQQIVDRALAGNTL